MSQEWAETSIPARLSHWLGAAPGNMCERHHRTRAEQLGLSVNSLRPTLRGRFEQCVFVPTTPALGPPGISTLSPCSLAWKQSSLVCSQGSCFPSFRPTPGQTICLGLLKLQNRALILSAPR